MRYFNLVKNVENWWEYLLFKFGLRNSDPLRFQARGDIILEVPHGLLHTFKEIFMEQCYMYGLRHTPPPHHRRVHSMRQLIIAIASALVIPLLFVLFSPVTHARVDETNSGREEAKAAPMGLTKSGLFDAALEYCRGGQYKKAIVHFKIFLLYYPQSGLADNAQFWIGECCRAQDKLEEAIAAYQRVIDDYPKGNKLPRAMLHQGFAYLKIDDERNAKLVLRKLTDEIPITEEAEIARNVLKRVSRIQTGRATSLSPDMREWRILKGTPHEEVPWIALREERTVDEEIASRDRVVEGYQIEIARAIKKNWSFPFLLFNIKRDEIPEAVVVLKLRNDGRILEISFKERSRNELFDESIVEAVEKSDPLPEFPHGYEKLYDEVEILFSLKGALFK
jgi:tol-pal system protein YbgF